MTPAAPETVRETITRATRRLAEAGSESPRLDAEVLLAAATGRTRTELLLGSSSLVDPEERERFEQLLDRRSRREPVAYLIGEKEFFSLAIEVDRCVLVPRPETETVVEAALERLATVDSPSGEPVRILDVGTGSGAIAVALASAHPEVRGGMRSTAAKLEVIALERSSGALEVARRNVARHAPAVRLVGGNLTRAIGPGTIDVVVSNPPYLSAADLAAAPPELGFEPEEALLGGGEDGLGVLRELVGDAPRVLRRGGWLVSEIGAGQAASASALARAAGLTEIAVRRDLAGLDRVLMARRSTAGDCAAARNG